ncbi:hypothetical protein PISMIDRAFT_475001 [Pisolithus microcarpus 441]|uniref:Unplaced genomic scaffold scaffold_472, whole genome shotgun sequence n=1 Tax=Pisolithus microcarpus 441 TaxID=765257 RepID=A0A0C9YNC0_9AGAM|nr:hypothetical protein PISMIDRAFT_475001 [Pisolithus microcarpus 441]
MTCELRNVLSTLAGYRMSGNSLSTSGQLLGNCLTFFRPSNQLAPFGSICVVPTCPLCVVCVDLDVVLFALSL